MLRRKKAPCGAQVPSMSAAEIITLFAGLAIVLFLFLTVGIDRELERREESEQWFYCNIKKEC